jgi:hypothetical protein
MKSEKNAMPFFYPGSRRTEGITRSHNGFPGFVLFYSFRRTVSKGLRVAGQGDSEAGQRPGVAVAAATIQSASRKEEIRRPPETVRST